MTDQPVQPPVQAGANPFNVVGAKPVASTQVPAPAAIPAQQTQPVVAPQEGIADKIINGIIGFIAKISGQADPRTGQGATPPPVVSAVPVQQPVAAPVPAPVVETPVVETPVVETPVVETPVVETPVVETPVVETPVVETPVVETPVVETPVVETPVVEIKPTEPAPTAENTTATVNPNQ